MLDRNIDKSNWIFALKIDKPQGEQPNYINQFLDVSLQLKINLGINQTDPPNCGLCKEKTKIVLRWFILFNEAMESAETYCFKCGMKVMDDVSDLKDMPEHLKGIRIITPNYTETIKEIKEYFVELNNNGK